MKNVIVYYTVKEGGEQGEAAMMIPMQDETAETLVNHYNRPGVWLLAAVIVENFLHLAEALKGREYVRGSIKCFQMKL